MQKGLFIVVDGPSATGKDSVIMQVLKKLGKLNLSANALEETKEANYDRSKILSSQKKGERAVAKAIISERKKLYLKKVIPHRSSNTIIIANRGEPSTLSYQTLKDNLSMEEVWNMHRKNAIPIPDLAVITNCSVKEAIRREKLRKASYDEKHRSFLSGKFTSDRYQIHKKYEKTKEFLEKKGINVIYLSTDKMNVPKASQRIVNFIKNKINYVHVN